MWLTPEQVVILPISEKYNGDAEKLSQVLNNSDIRALVDERAEKIGRKIRDTEVEKVPFMLIIGEKEENEGKVSVRVQGDGDKGAITTEEFVKMVQLEIERLLNR